METIGLETEGLYRVPADRKKRNELIKHFDSNFKLNVPSSFDLEELSPAPNTLAGCIQWYISGKNLPEPIIPTKYLNDLQAASKLESDYDKVERLSHIFTQLGAENVTHWQTLKFLFEHFLKVSSYSEKNKMDARNIATCLFPTFFPPDPLNFIAKPNSLQTDSFIFIDTLVLLIVRGSEIFLDNCDLVKELKEKQINAKESTQAKEAQRLP